MPNEPTNPENPNKPTNPETPNNPTTPNTPNNPTKPDSSNTINKTDNSSSNKNTIGNTVNTEKNTSNKAENQEDKATGLLPKTGNGYGKWFILIAIEILIVIAFVSRKKGKRVEEQINKKTKMFMTFLVTGIISIQLVGTIYATVSDYVAKGELNDDGEINYADLHLLELHLVNLKLLPEEKLQNADMNNDDKITVTDLTLLVQKLEKNLDYEVSISDAGQLTYYLNKENDVILKFIGDASYGATIKSVVINGNTYEVKQLEDNYTYEVNLGKEKEAGVKEYHFTSATLDNNKIIETDATIKIEILKAEPKIENYLAEEDINNSKINLSFNLKDTDNSITSAKIEILNEASEVLQVQEIVAGKNNIEVVVEDGKKYKVNFVISYDLDTNTLEQEEDHSGILEIEKDLEFIIDYRL